jgi:hypothetical protein
VTAQLPSGARTCFSARARDAVGNTSDWSPPVCQLLDGSVPVVTSAPTLPAVVGATSTQPVHLSWTYAEGGPSGSTPSGIAGYDVRRGDLAGGSWTQPSAWSSMTAAIVDDTLSAGAGACWQSRARDLAGNVSDWSQSVCQRSDGTAPRMGTPASSPTWLARTPSAVSYSVSATDDDRVASYEIQTRTTPAGVARRAWVIAAAASPTGSMTTRALAAGTEGCVRVRARDAVGNVAAWAAERCATVPVNDTSLSYRGGAVRHRSSLALNGDFVTLSRKGSSATSGRQTGRTIGLWLIRGRKLGTLDVYAGTRRVARVTGAASSTRRVLVPIRVPNGFTGSIRLVNVTKAPTQVDAITTLR